MNRYDSYKDSGVEWLGNIPSSWNKIKLKHKGDVIIGLSYKPDDVVNKNEGTLVMRSSNIQNGKPTFDDNVYVQTEIPEKLTTKEGDILICSRNGSRRLIGKNCLITKEIEGMTWGVFMTMYRSPYSKYMYWLLNSPIFKSQSGLFLTSTINQLTVSTLENMVLPFTENVNEQQQIVSFLDTKTSLIDSLIEKTQRKIELLKEKRTSLINEVVTKGLNPNVDMKNSGVEWIGEIPSHWSKTKMKHVVDIFGRIGYRGYTTEDIVDEGEGVITISPSNIFEDKFSTDNSTFLSWEKYHESPEIQIFPNDILLVKTGSTIGKTSIIPEDVPEMTINPQLVVLKNIKIFPKYLYYQTVCKFIKESFDIEQTGSSTPTISQEKVKDFPILEPPLSEQQQIVEYLDEQTGLIDKTISIEEKRIELLKEYRQSLISEVVTGKRKVV